MKTETRTYYRDSIKMNHEEWHESLLKDMELFFLKTKIVDKNRREAILSVALRYGRAFENRSYTVEVNITYDTPHDILDCILCEDLYEEIYNLSDEDLKELLSKFIDFKEQNGKLCVKRSTDSSPYRAYII